MATAEQGFATDCLQPTLRFASLRLPAAAETWRWDALLPSYSLQTWEGDILRLHRLPVYRCREQT